MLILALLACGGEVAPTTRRALPTPDDLERRCGVVGEPRVEEPSPGVFVARGFDLANTVVVQTADGRVVIDAGMSPARSEATRAALDAVTSGPVRALIFTHSHIDHVGGASVWAEPNTEIWATDAFTTRFFAQYGVFLPAESTRAARQFGVGLDPADLPCSSIGHTADVRAAMQSGARMPTHTFSGTHTLEVGGVTLELVEAHGETDDQLFVHLPDAGVLLPGDNVYAAFPNLYTIRGTRPRPTDEWVASLDAMRARDPALLVPSHTEPVEGRESVRARLTAYRDAIQWVRDSVVRAANAGTPLDAIGAAEALAGDPALAELYGQLDWSARAIYTNELGWFDGRASQLYPLPPDDRAKRLIGAMGGREAVLAALDASDDPRWALELLELLEASGEQGLNTRFADAYEALAATTANTNGRAYLLVSARERRAGRVEGVGEPTLAEDFVEGLPIVQVMQSTAARLRPGAAQGVHETVVLAFTDHDPAVLTVRNGVLEVVWGTPLPGTPEPLATAHVSTRAWKDLALQRRSAAGALADGSLGIEGSALGFRAFMDRFEQGLAPPAERLP
ncbi:MAG: MBL fold metallo-hydrolase [Alphaproteobacteria bacterium]|nr:MBL fold metallo-hydrolase [Alphaproteobacteria bacterium]